MKKIALFSTLALAAVATLASCQKENTVEIPVSTIYLTTGGVSANEVNYVVNYDALTGSETTVGATEFSVKLASTEPAGADITVTLKADETLVASPWTLLPEAAYTLSATTLTLAKDATESEAVTVTLHPEAVAETGQYLLPLSVEVNEGKAELSATAAVVNVKFVRNRLNSDIVPDGWSKISSERFTAGAYSGYAGWDYSDSNLGIASAFDGDNSTDWYSCSVYYDYASGAYVASEDYAGYTYDYDGYTYVTGYGCYAEVKFSEPVALNGLILSMNSDSQYYNYRARRASIMFKYEGDEDYTWDKDYDDGYNESTEEYEDFKGDEGYYYFCPMLEGEGQRANDLDGIPGYQPSPADFLIAEPQYENAVISLEEKLAGKKVESLIIMVNRLVNSGQYDYNTELQDYSYLYQYDLYYGTAISEITFFE